MGTRALGALFGPRGVCLEDDGHSLTPRCASAMVWSGGRILMRLFRT